MKRTVQKVVNRLGYHISRVGEGAGAAERLADPFALQAQLIEAAEPVILDVGANVGDVTAIYRQLFPLACIHSFEPFPESFEALSKRMERDDRTFCHRVALSDKAGTAVFNSNLSAATNSLLPTDERGAGFFGAGLLDTTSQIEVGTTTIDEFCLQERIPRVDILKLDAQGAEFAILQGAKSMLANGAISLVYTELIMVPTYKGQHKLHEYLSFLEAFDYNLLDFFNPERSRNQLIQADALFSSPGLVAAHVGP